MVRAVSSHTGAMKANLLHAVTLVAGAVALGSCAAPRMIPTRPATTPTPTPPPAPAAPLPAPPKSTAWADMPATPGDWRWGMEGGRSVARFAGQLVLRCDPAARTVQIERVGSTAATALVVRTQTLERRLAAAQPGLLAATLPARDPLLDAMAFSKGRFAVEAAGLPTLYVPSWTEVSRVVEDCR